MNYLFNTVLNLIITGIPSILETVTFKSKNIKKF